MVAIVKKWRRTARELRTFGNTPVADAFDACADDLEKRMLTFAGIKRDAALKYGVTVDDIESKTRRRPVVIARNEAMARCRHELDATLEEIGKEFNRSHATVIHGIRCVASVFCVDK